MPSGNSLMSWLRQYVPASGFPSQTPSGAPVVYNAWDDPSWWLRASSESVSDTVRNTTPEDLYRRQPYLRTVVNFMARNVAQCSVQAFNIVSETDRVRDRDSVLGQLLKQPNPNTTQFELIRALVSDLALYDTAFWWVSRNPDTPSGWQILRLPVPWVTRQGEHPWGYDKVTATFPGNAPIDVPPEQLVTFHGWSPLSENDGSSPVDALKDILIEQIEAVKYRYDVWRRGGKVSSVITRPAGVRWSDAAREQFAASWKSRFTGNGSETGGTPILEDGMTINKIDFSAQEQQFMEGSKLALNTVASAYHVNPAMIGLLDSATYSSTREFRKMLYGDTLGPIFAEIEDRINTFVLPMLGLDSSHYVEFNINEKLQGSFEEQAAVLSTLVGAPIMTRNEGRARLNLPSVAEGEELITPLNVVEGGQASPRDTGTQNENPLGENPDQPKAGLVALPEIPAEVLERHQKRAAMSALSKKSAGYEIWWDAPRWDRELAKDACVTIGVAHAYNEEIRKGLDDGHEDHSAPRQERGA